MSVQISDAKLFPAQVGVNILEGCLSNGRYLPDITSNARYGGSFIDMAKRNLTNFSLFSGAGGFDIGLEKAGFETRVCVESEKYCQKTLRANREKFAYHDLQIFGDITELDPTDLLENSGVKPGDVDLVSGGPPCQAFSTAGHRGSINDPRGRLFLDFVRIVDQIGPRFFVMENVRGLKSAALQHRPLNERGDCYPPLSDIEELGSMLHMGILPAFKEIGYQVVWGTLNALDYGAAQDRERLFIIGSKNSELPMVKGALKDLKGLVPPTHSRKAKHGNTKAKVLGEVIGDLEDDPGPYMEYSPNRAKVFKRIPEGKNWRYIRDSGLFSQQELEDFMGGAYSSSGGRVGFWRRLEYDKWAPTLTTSPVQKATGLCHPRQDRPLSVKEYARIQGFPDDWELVGPLAARYRQLGNAVPVELGNAVGTTLKGLMKNNRS